MIFGMIIRFAIVTLLATYVTLFPNTMKWILNELEQAPVKYSNYW